MNNKLDAEILINNQIEELRAKMIQAANTHGMDHPSVITYSRMLDECMNKLLQKQKLKRVKCS
jgi:molybdopterin-guanine dinucleotide biosynthesis protein A